MKKTSVTIGILAMALTLTIAAVAFAHGGYGRHMGANGGHMMGPGYGWGHMDDGSGYGSRGRGCGGRIDLSDEEAAKLDAAREKFFDETRELRGQMDEKQIAMRNEMAKDNPDEATVVKVQKELSELRAEFDQKAVSHRLEMRKLMPEKFKGGGYGRGAGKGRGYCWQ